MSKETEATLKEPPLAKSETKLGLGKKKTRAAINYKTLKK